jgi:hypothetical protein
MTKVAAILSGTETADRVIQQLADLQIEGLDWRVYRPEVDHERLMPGWPGGSTPAASAGAAQPIGVAIVTDMPEDELLEEKGIAEDEADFYSQSLAHGATVIIVETPSAQVSTIRQLLQAAGATRVSAE